MTSLLTSLCWCFNAHYCRVTEPELCIFFKISVWPYQKLCLLRPPCLQCWCFCEEQHRRGLSAKVQCLTFQSCLHPRSCQWQLPSPQTSGVAHRMLGGAVACVVWRTVGEGCTPGERHCWRPGLWRSTIPAAAARPGHQDAGNPQIVDGGMLQWNR